MMRPGLVRPTCGAVHGSVLAATVAVTGYPGAQDRYWPA